MSYYSVQYQVLCLVDDEPSTNVSCDYSFVLVRADSFEHAFQRAVELVSDQETEYENAAGNKVRWVVSEIAEIVLLSEELDGVEVGNVLASLSFEEPLSFDSKFAPEKSSPFFRNIDGSIRNELKEV